MEGMTVTPMDLDFTAAHAALRRWVDGDILAGASCAVLAGVDIVDLHCEGWANKESRTPMRADHIFRVFSNTKLVTSCAALLLYEDGRFHLDDPIDRFIPQLAKRRVLRPGAVRLDDTEPAAGPVTIRHLMSHSAGLSHPLFGTGTTINKAYHERKVPDTGITLSGLMDVLADLPLIFHPGTSWGYSVATDVVARLVEVLSGQRFDAFIRARIFEPLGMGDTGFVVPEESRHRFAALYAGADPLEPWKPGLTRADDAPYPGAYLRPVPRLSGNGGLVSTLPDMIALMRSLLSGSPALLKPETVTLMMTNQLPPGVWLSIPGLGEHRGKAFGLAGSILLERSRLEPNSAIGEMQWGGIAGTHWWLDPKSNTAGLLMTQRQMAFWHPFFFEFKKLVYEALNRRQ
jgi:CubicO group peptidase (beta-lactamase class C family)